MSMCIPFENPAQQLPRCRGPGESVLFPQRFWAPISTPVGLGMGIAPVTPEKMWGLMDQAGQEPAAAELDAEDTISALKPGLNHLSRDKRSIKVEKVNLKSVQRNRK